VPGNKPITIRHWNLD